MSGFPCFLRQVSVLERQYRLRVERLLLGLATINWLAIIDRYAEPQTRSLVDERKAPDRRSAECASACLGRLETDLQ
ncbi:hypothetical protein [Fodinicurvata halophila]|uniref:hypothetical protein n=1 Tax=Fodinicurvata halophila TaxID=1419723 RepID=UPI0036D360BA